MTDIRLSKAFRDSSLTAPSARAWTEARRAGWVIALPCPDGCGASTCVGQCERGCDCSDPEPHRLGDHYGLCRACRPIPDCSRCEGQGRLPPHESVALAAYLGDPGAREVVGDHCPLCGISNRPGCPWCHTNTAHPDGHNDLGAWARGLSRWGWKVCIRAAVAAAKRAWQEVLSEEGDPHGDGSGCPGGRVCSALCGVRDAIEAAEAWLVCPCSKHWEAWAMVPRPGCPRWAPIVRDGDTTLTAEAVNWIVEAANLVTESVVRKTVREALIQWLIISK